MARHKRLLQQVDELISQGNLPTNIEMLTIRGIYETLYSEAERSAFEAEELEVETNNVLDEAVEDSQIVAADPAEVEILPEPAQVGVQPEPVQVQAQPEPVQVIRQDTRSVPAQTDITPVHSTRRHREGPKQLTDIGNIAGRILDMIEDYKDPRKRKYAFDRAKTKLRKQVADEAMRQYIDVNITAMEDWEDDEISTWEEDHLEELEKIAEEIGHPGYQEAPEEVQDEIRRRFFGNCLLSGDVESRARIQAAYMKQADLLGRVYDLIENRKLKLNAPITDIDIYEALYTPKEREAFEGEETSKNKRKIRGIDRKQRRRLKREKDGARVFARIT